MAKICKNCGFPIQDGESYCGKCGTSVHIQNNNIYKQYKPKSNHSRVKKDIVVVSLLIIYIVGFTWLLMPSPLDGHWNCYAVMDNGTYKSLDTESKTFTFNQDKMTVTLDLTGEKREYYYRISGYYLYYTDSKDKLNHLSECNSFKITMHSSNELHLNNDRVGYNLNTDKYESNFEELYLKRKQD